MQDNQETKRTWQNHHGLILDKVSNFEVIECEKCGFAHVVPLPTLEELETIYHQKYFTAEKPLYLQRDREDIAWLNCVYQQRYSLFEKFLAYDRRRLLDVGSGPGFFLLYGQKLGWETLGIEPSAQAAAHSRKLGLSIIEGFLNQETAQELPPFDVVNLHEVLEHVSAPAELLELVYQLLNPGGLICLTVPNDYNPLQKIAQQSLHCPPWWVAPPHHLNYFNFASLERLVRQAGFEPLYSTATFPMEIFLLMGENYLGCDETGRKMHSLRKNMELTMSANGSRELLEKIYSGLAEHNIGRECVIIAQTQLNCLD